MLRKTMSNFVIISPFRYLFFLISPFLSSKFVENEYEKCDRLVELVVGYLEKDRAAQARFDAGRANGDEGDEEGEEEEMRQLARWVWVWVGL